jgi:hypothetical protein
MILNMNRYVGRQLGPWATFAFLMLISLTAWGMGSPELALVLALGAMGALVVAIGQRLHVARFMHRIWPAVRHHG